MKNTQPSASGTSVKAEADRLADFVLFTQRSCILNLSSELNKGNVSFPQSFLLTYLSSEEYLTMSDIAKKNGPFHRSRYRPRGSGWKNCPTLSEFMHPKTAAKSMVRITSKGVDLVSKMRKEIATDLAGILAGMDEEEAETVETHQPCA